MDFDLQTQTVTVSVADLSLEPLSLTGPYRFDPIERRAAFNGQSLTLTNRDFDLAYYLLLNQDRFIARDELLDAVWQRPSSVETRTLNMHISRVRTAFRRAGDTQLRISTKYNHGYWVTLADEWADVG